ncbi:hypothetical protein ACI2KR_06565 [Pseudomonas luteola]
MFTSAREMVSLHVHANVSGLMRHLVFQETIEYDSKFDYETAVEDAGWDKVEDGYFNEAQDIHFPGNAEMLCKEHDIDVHEFRIDPYEHWIVSDWLAAKLKREGEIIESDMLRTFNLNVWGRCTTGQAIYMDSVIEKIAQEHINNLG